MQVTGSFEGGRRSAQARGSVRIPPTSRLTPQPPNPGVERTPSSPCRPGGSGRARRRLPARLPAPPRPWEWGPLWGSRDGTSSPSAPRAGSTEAATLLRRLSDLTITRKRGGPHSYRTCATPESSPFYTSNRGVGGVAESRFSLKNMHWEKRGVLSADPGTG